MGTTVRSKAYGIWVEPIPPAGDDEPGFLTNLGRDLSYETYECAEREAELYRGDFAGVAWLSVREKGQPAFDHMAEAA